MFSYPEELFSFKQFVKCCLRANDKTKKVLHLYSKPPKEKNKSKYCEWLSFTIIHVFVWNDKWDSEWNSLSHFTREIHFQQFIASHFAFTSNFYLFYGVVVVCWPIGCLIYGMTQFRAWASLSLSWIHTTSKQMMAYWQSYFNSH